MWMKYEGSSLVYNNARMNKKFANKQHALIILRTWGLDIVELHRFWRVWCSSHLIWSERTVKNMDMFLVSGEKKNQTVEHQFAFPSFLSIYHNKLLVSYLFKWFSSIPHNIFKHSTHRKLFWKSLKVWK
jgi:hypothetical protein